MSNGRPDPSQQPLVYIVDDDEAVRDALTLLAEARGWEVRTFDSAADYMNCQSRDASERPACLVLDLQMPDMNGAELQEALSSGGSAIPTIILTAWPNGKLARRAQAAGAQRVISKPFAPSEWVKVVEEMLETG